MEGMTKEHRKALDKTLVSFTTDLGIEEALVYLQSKEILTESDVEAIDQQTSTRGKKVTELVKRIKQKGDKSYFTFKKFLEETLGSEHIAKELDKNLKEVKETLANVTQEREKKRITEKWKKLEEKFHLPRFSCQHDSIHQYQGISRNINVLLIGKCGAGKSATGNTLLGEDIFEESDTGAPETKSVQIETIQEGTFNITVVDTPGIQNEKLLLNVVEKMIDFEGGIHLFLLVCNLNADQEITKVISRVLAETACKQSIVILTNARARFVGKTKMIMRDYIERQKDREGPLADLFQLVQDRVIAVENFFDEEDDMMIDQQRQKLLTCLAQVIKDNKGLVYSKKSFQNAKTRIKLDEALKDMEGRLHEYLLQTYLKTLSQQQLNNIQTTLDDNVKKIMQACYVSEPYPLINEGHARQYMRLFIQENKNEISRVKEELNQEQEREEKRETEKRRKSEEYKNEISRLKKELNQEKERERKRKRETEIWKKNEENFHHPRFFCEHDSIHQYRGISRDINVLLIGKCGAGKSATGNTLLGKDIFEESDTDAPETKSVQIETTKEHTFNITVVDTPGIQNEELLLNVVEKMIDFEGGIHLFLLVCKKKEDQEITEVISRVLAETACKQCIVILTNARVRFVGKKKMILRDYIERQKDRKGPLADLFQLVQDRVIAVENCFDEDDVMMIDQQRQKLLCYLAQVIKDNKGLVYSKKKFQNVKTRIKQYQDMEGRLHEYLLHKYLKNLSQQQLDNIQTTLDDNVKDIMQACKVSKLCPLITEEDAMQYMRLFIQENEKKISQIQADGKRQIEIWKDLEKKFYCINCEYDNIGDYRDVPEEINILLIGKTGSGKSATGNTIMGNHFFKESGSSASVTKTIDMKDIKESGFHITVIDTPPSIFDTAEDFQNEDMVLEIAKTMINLKGGIHLFLLVLGSTLRFTKEEQDTVKNIEKVLGKNFYQNCLVVLTNARTTFGSGNSLQEYVKQETNDKGKFANLLKLVNNRIIAVENVFDDDFLTEKHRQKLLCCFAHIIHENKGSVYSNKAFGNAKARVEQQEEERKNRIARDTELTHMKIILRNFLVQRYLKNLTVKELDNILPKVRKETLLIMRSSGVNQLPFITSEDVKTYVENFIRENEVLIAKLKDVKIQEAIQQQKYKKTRQRLTEEEEIIKMQSIVLPLVSKYLKEQSKKDLKHMHQDKQLPVYFTDQIFADLESYKVNVDIQHTKNFIQATFFENSTQLQGYIDGKDLLKESLEENSKQLQQLQKEQKLNEFMGILKSNLYYRLEYNTDKELEDLNTDLADKDDSVLGNWKPLFTELVGSEIEGSDISINEVTNSFLKQNYNWLQSILVILLEEKQQQKELKRLQERRKLRHRAFSIISTEIKNTLKSYLAGKTTSEFAELEAQIGKRKVPKDIFDKVNEKLTSEQQHSLIIDEIEAEIIKQIKEQNKVIEECKLEAGICFPGSTEVMIKERGIAKISNVRVDDEILVFDENGHLFYDKVYLISHAREDENITFVRLQTSSDKDLRISPGHLLPVGSLGSNVAAKDVSIGNVIFTLQGGVMMPDKVTSVTYELCRGAYCPMTMHGTIVVNDVAASCYTTFFPSPLAHALLSPIRFLFSYLPLPLFNKLLPYDIEEGMPVLLIKCRSIVTMWRSFVDKE